MVLCTQVRWQIALHSPIARTPQSNMIAHSGVPPFTEQLAEQFAGHACNSMSDPYVGYNE